MVTINLISWEPTVGYCSVSLISLCFLKNISNIFSIIKIDRCELLVIQDDLAEII